MLLIILGNVALENKLNIYMFLQVLCRASISFLACSISASENNHSGKQHRQLKISLIWNATPSRTACDGFTHQTLPSVEMHLSRKYFTPAKRAFFRSLRQQLFNVSDVAFICCSSCFVILASPFELTLMTA